MNANCWVEDDFLFGFATASATCPAGVEVLPGWNDEYKKEEKMLDEELTRRRRYSDFYDGHNNDLPSDYYSFFS